MSRLLRLVVGLLGWPLVAAFAGAYLGYFIPPSSLWWLQVLALVIPGLALALLPVAVLALIVRRRILAFTAIASLVLFGLRHAPFGLLDRTEPPDGLQSIRMLTFNTHGVAGLHGVDEDGVLRVIVESDADVLCLQEFGAETDRRRMGGPQRLLQNRGYSAVVEVPPGRRESRRPIFTRLPVRDSEFLTFDTPSESYGVRALLEGPDGPFRVYNVHLRGFSSRRPWRAPGRIYDPRDWYDFFRSSGGAYLGRAREAQSLYEYVAEESYPYVVCGDFNSTSNQWAYRRIGHKMHDAFRMAGKGWGKTYHASMPVVRIDYILASSEWRVVSADVLSPSGGSDHRPVISELGINPRGTD